MEARLLAILLGLLALTCGVHAQKTCSGIANCIPLTSCGTRTESDSYFLLMQDLRNDRSCLLFTGQRNTVDLNRFTITYGDLDFAGAENPGFEQGTGTIPAGWDLSNAPHAKRQPVAEKLFYDSYSLHMENIAGDSYAEEYVLSSPVYLPQAGKYAAYAAITGGRYDKVKATIGIDGISTACNNKISNQNSVYQGTDMSIGIICEFETASPATVRLKISLGTVDQAATTEINVDEADIRPIGDKGIGPNGYNTHVKEIMEGTVLQGRAKGAYSPAVQGWSDSSIHDMTIKTNGIDSQDIYGVWSNNAEVYNNYLEANGKMPLHRHYLFAMIDYSRTSGGLDIHDNTLMNGPHVGIMSSDYDGNVLPAKSDIYRNTVKTRIVATNGFSVTAASNTDIHDNILQPFQGHGIGANPNQNIYNNIIEPRTWPCSEYSSYYYPNSAHGIRIKTYGSGKMSNLRIWNNTIIGKTNPQAPNCYTEVSGISNMLTDSEPANPPNPTGNEIWNNTVTVSTENYLQQHAIAYMNAGSWIDVHDNSFQSNHIIMEMSEADTGGGNDMRFVSNRLIKGPNPSGFSTMRYGYFRTYNFTYVDAALEGADLKDVYAMNTYSPPVDYTVSWTLDVFVKDSSGNPVSGAAVRATDSDSRTFTAISDSSGKAKLELREFTFTYANTASIRQYSPYAVSITHAKGSHTRNIYMQATARIDAVLGSGTCGDDYCGSGETCSSCSADCIQNGAADDSPCDNCVRQDELIGYISKWKSGQVTLAQLMEAIRLWKSGC